MTQGSLSISEASEIYTGWLKSTDVLFDIDILKLKLEKGCFIFSILIVFFMDFLVIYYSLTFKELMKPCCSSFSQGLTGDKWREDLQGLHIALKSYF